MVDDPHLFVIAVLAGAVRAAAPLFFAGLGEVFAERAGVINLGIEGMMLMGALVAVIVSIATGSAWWGVPAAIAVGVALAACHGVVSIWLQGDQIASGIALIIFGTGLSAFLGINYVSQQVPGIPAWQAPLLGDIPVLGPIFFQHDALVYLMYLLVPLGWLALYHTHWGLKVRAVGEDPQSATAAGINVHTVRFSAVLVGGGLAGLGGAYLSVAYTQLWLENMVAGRGLIALALVVFAGWDPIKLLVGALLFGAVSALQLRLQASGVGVSPYLLSMLPYVLTIVVLVSATLRTQRRRGGVPRALGLPFLPVK